MNFGLNERESVREGETSAVEEEEETRTEMQLAGLGGQLEGEACGGRGGALQQERGAVDGERGRKRRDGETRLLEGGLVAEVALQPHTRSLRGFPRRRQRAPQQARPQPLQRQPGSGRQRQHHRTVAQHHQDPISNSSQSLFQSGKRRSI